MKKVLLIIAGVVIVASLALMAVRFFSGDEDTWICQNGAWQKHGQPSAPQPSTVCK